VCCIVYDRRALLPTILAVTVTALLGWLDKGI
jgi:hypothetical protein